MNDKPSPDRAQSDARHEAIRAALAELRAEYAEVLPGLVTELLTAVTAVCQSTSGELELRQVATLAHRLHGGAGSYGFSGVSEVAGRMEEMLHEHEKNGLPVELLVEGLRVSAIEMEETSARELAEFLSPSS